MLRILKKISAVVNENLQKETSPGFALIPFLFALGIALYFALPFEPSPWLCLGIFEIWLLLFYLFRHKGKSYIFVSGIIIMAGFLNIEAHTLYRSRHITTFDDTTTTYIRGKIADISYSEKGKQRILLEKVSDYDNPLPGNFRITLTLKQDNLNIGQCVETVATLFARSPLPIVGGYQLNRKYFYEGLSAVGYADAEVFPLDCQNKSTFSWSEQINSWRFKTANQIGKILPPQAAGVADAVLIGEKSQIPTQVIDNFRNSGLAHFLSVSGLHLGSIAALAFFFIRFLCVLLPGFALKYDCKKIAAFFAIIFAFIYLLISGMAIPAQRAFIMTSVVFIGIIFNRQAISIRMVSFAALLILIISPQALISIGFQMSFAAVYALVAFYEAYGNKLNIPSKNPGIIKKIFYYLSGIIICDLVASLATTPFALYHFHRVAVYTSLGNLLAGPLIGLWLMPAILLCLITLPFGLSYYPLLILGQGIDILLHITDFVAHLPHSVWFSDTLPFYGFVLLILGGYWLCVWQRKWRHCGWILIVIGIISMFNKVPTPDVVFSPQMQQIALRSTADELIMLPLKKDSWLQNVWQENLQIIIPESKENKKLRQLLQNGGTDDRLRLSCQNKHCVYANNISFNNYGEISINKQIIDNSAGGYIYMQPLSWRPLWNNNSCRPWQICR